MAGKRDVKFTISAEDKASAVVQAVLAKLTGGIKGLLGAVATLVGGISLGALFKSAVERSREAERAMRDLALAVTNAGGDFAKLRPSVDDTIDRLARLTKFTDDDLTAALASMVQLTGNVAGSMANLSVAADLAVARHMELGQAADLVARVMTGQTKALREVGIVTNDAAEGLQLLQQRFGGAAANEMTAFERGLNLVNKGWDRFLDALGNSITGAKGSQGALGALADMLASVAHWIEQNEGAIQGFVTGVWSLAVGITTVIKDALYPFRVALQGLVDLADVATTKLANLFRTAKDAAAANAALDLRLQNRFNDRSGIGAGTVTVLGPRGPGSATLAPSQQQLKAWEALRDEFTRLAATTDSGATKAEKFALQIEAWAKKARAAKLPAAEFTRDLTALLQTLDAIKAGEQNDALADMAGAMAAEFGDAADVLRQQLIAQLVKLGEQMAKVTDPKQLAAFTAAWQRLDASFAKRVSDMQEIVDAEKLAKGILDDIAAGGQGATLGDISAIQEKIDRLRQLEKEAGDDTERRKVLTAAINNLLGVQQQLQDGLAARVQAINDYLQQQRQHIADIARGMAEFARSIVAAGQAFGTMDDKTAAALQNVISLGEAVAKIVEMWGTGASFASWMGPIGLGVTAVAALGRSLFGGESPQEKAAREAAIKAAQDAAEALALLAKNAGDAAKLGASGTQIGGARAALGTYNRSSGLAENLPIGTQGMAYLRGELAKVGLSFKELQELARGLGLALDDIPTAGQILTLKDALDTLDFKAFTDTFAGQLDRLNRSFDLFGVGDAKDKFAQFVALLTDPKVGAPSLFSALAGLDLSSAGGIADAKKMIQDLFTKAASGQLTSADLNGMNLQQFLDALAALMGFVNDAAGTIDKGKSALQALQDALHDIDMSAEILGTSKADVLREKVAAFGKVFPQLAGVLDGLDLSNAADLGTLKDRLREVFQQFHDGDAKLPDGTKLEDLIQAILALMGAAGDAASGIQSAAGQMAAAAGALQTDWEVFGTSAQDQAKQLAGLYGFDLGDISTQAGRDAAIARLQARYKANRDDGDMAQQILAVLRIIRGVKDEGGGAALGGADVAGIGAGAAAVSVSGFQALTTVQGDQMLDLERGILAATRSSAGYLKEMRDSVAAIPRVSAPAWARPSANTPGGATSVTAPIQVGPINIDVIAPGADPRSFGAQIGDEIIREINLRLGRGALLADLVRGSVGRS